MANPFYGIIGTGPEASATIPQYYLLSPFPQFTAVQASFPTGGYSDYSAFQLKVEKRFSHGLTTLLSFTGQKLIDDFSQISNVGNQTGGIQNIYDDQQQRSVSSNDQSRRLVVSGTYQFPLGRGKDFGKNWSRPVDALLGGWQVNGIYTYTTGFPISVTAANNCTGCGIQTLRPNNDGQSAALSGSVSERLNGYFNTAVFSQPAAFTFGSVGRTLPDVRNPSAHNIDFSLFKSFRPVERLTVEFRAEAYNLLNQVVFGGPGTGINSNTFGVISSQANGPRTIQFALKLLF
ncbi:Cna B-type protein (fragment) [Candidatus Sulfopaludibacter sp. SbA4]